MKASIKKIPKNRLVCVAKIGTNLESFMVVSNRLMEANISHGLLAGSGHTLNVMVMREDVSRARVALNLLFVTDYNRISKAHKFLYENN